MEAQNLAVACDASKLLADIALLVQAAQRSLQVRQRLLDLGHLGTHLVRVDVDGSGAASTSELRIRLESVDALFELVTAVRAGQFDGLVGEEIFHG